MSTDPCNREAVLDGIYKALVRYDREARSLREWRRATRMTGPTIKRGTRRAALAHYLTDAVMASLDSWERKS